MYKSNLYKFKIITRIEDNFLKSIIITFSFSTRKENATNLAYSNSLLEFYFRVTKRSLQYLSVTGERTSVARRTLPERSSERRPRERKSPLGFRGIIEDDVSILDDGSIVTRGPRFSRSLVVNMRRIPRAWTSWRDIGSRGTDNLAGGRPWSRTLVPRISLTPINRSFFFEPTAPAFSYVVCDLASKLLGIISIIEVLLISSIVILACFLFFNFCVSTFSFCFFNFRNPHIGFLVIH